MQLIYEIFAFCIIIEEPREQLSTVPAALRYFSGASPKCCGSSSANLGVVYAGGLVGYVEKSIILINCR